MGLLTVDPKKRLTFEKILKEPWLQQGIPKQVVRSQSSQKPQLLQGKHAKNMTYDQAMEQKQ